MAFKPLHLLSLTILLVLISPIAHSIRDLPSNHVKPSPFHLNKDLQDCQKGTSTKGLNGLKHYLKRFGYLKYQNQSHFSNDYFDDALELALMTYQENYNLTLTGTLDASTMSKMALPRCGVPDVVNGVNTMRRESRYHNQPSKSIHTVAHYVFFPNEPRWSPSKTQLTYSFDQTILEAAKGPVASAFQKWASATQYFSFSEAQNDEESDLVIGFYSGEHGDGAPFDGPGGIIAHAFAPENGHFHYDADETWGNAPDPTAMDLESVALHEIGHLLGLGHSPVVDAIMHPGIAPGESKDLNVDDIDGIKALYNL